MLLKSLVLGGLLVRELVLCPVLLLRLVLPSPQFCVSYASSKVSVPTGAVSRGGGESVSALPARSAMGARLHMEGSSP